MTEIAQESVEGHPHCPTQCTRQQLPKSAFVQMLPDVSSAQREYQVVPAHMNWLGLSTHVAAVIVNYDQARQKTRGPGGVP